MFECNESESEEKFDEMGENEYVVEAIKGWRYHLKKGRKEWFVKWVGWDDEDNTWEPKDNLTNCEVALEEFERSLSRRQLELYHSSRPDKLTGFQRNAEFERCVGADTGHSSDEEDSHKPGKQKFYCLCNFEDDNLPEEVTVTEFFRYQPEEALEFFEERIFRKK